MSIAQDRFDRRTKSLLSDWKDEQKLARFNELRRDAWEGRLPRRTDLTFSDRFKFALMRLYMEYESDELVEQRTGRSTKQLRRYIESEDLPFSVLVHIAKWSRVPLSWIVENNDDYLALHVLDDVPAEPESQKAISARTDAIPNLLTHAGMGNGGLDLVEVDGDGRPLDLYTDGAWSFPAGIAAGFSRFSGIYALQVEGDSMEPTYAGGATVFVDTRRKDPKAPGCFIVDYGDGLMLKRVELVGGTDLMAVISDNRELYRSYEFPREQVTIWGRVIAKWEWVK